MSLLKSSSCKCLKSVQNTILILYQFPHRSSAAMAADTSRFVLPASPNWYCSNVADCSLNKTYAFGARNCVYLLDVSSQPPAFEGQLTGHTERVTSVCFSKHKLHANFVASGSDDKTVKIWDAETKLKLLEHKAHSVRIAHLLL